MTSFGTSAAVGITAACVMAAPWGVLLASPTPRPPLAQISNSGANEAGLVLNERATWSRSGPGMKRTRNISAMIVELKADSGLTVAQIGRLLGVTRRSIHNWVAGSPISEIHADRIRDLSDLVFGLDASAADDRRERLLDSTKGPSLYRKFMEESQRAERIQFGVPVEERLGI